MSAAAANFVFFTGGVRSGKTRLAQLWAEASRSSSLYLATCLSRDAEMAARIASHQKARSSAWQTLEEPLEPWGAFVRFQASHPGFQGSVVLDSLGMWINNLMAQNLSPRSILSRCRKLSLAFASLSLPCAIVSEECGLGFVPLTPIARKYGDLLGVANQMMAQAATTAIMAISGLPLLLKGALPAPWQAFCGEKKCAPNS